MTVKTEPIVSEYVISIDTASLNKAKNEIKDFAKEMGDLIEKNSKISLDIETSKTSEEVNKLKDIVSELEKEVNKLKKPTEIKIKLNEEDIKRSTANIAVGIKWISDEAVKAGANITRAVTPNDTAFVARTNKLKKQLEDTTIVIKKTGKEMDAITKERYIELLIDEKKIQNDIQKAQNIMREWLTTQQVKVDADISLIKQKIKEAEGLYDSLEWKTKREKLELKIEDKSIEKMRMELKRLQTEKNNLTAQAKLKLDLDNDQLNKKLKDTKSRILNLKNVWKETTGVMWGYFNGLAQSIRSWLFSTFGALSAWGALYSWIRNFNQLLNESKQIALDRESAFTGIRKTTEGTEEQFKTLKKELVGLTREIPSTFEEIARIGELWGQMGVPIDKLKEFTKAVSQIATTTNISVDQAALQFSRLGNVLWIPFDQIDKIASAVVDLGNNFAAQEDEILNFTQRIAGSGRVAGMTAWDLTGISTALTAVGIRAEMWWSAVSNAMLRINDAVASGNKSLEWFAKVSGLSSKEFQKLRKENASEAFTLFVEWIRKSWDNANTVISELLGNNVRTKTAFLNLAGAGDLLREAIERWNIAFDQWNALQAEAELRYWTTASQMAIVTNEMREQKQILGEQLLPVYLAFEKTKVALTKWFLNLAEAVGGAKNAIWLLLTAVLVPIWIILAPLILKIWLLKLGFVALWWAITLWIGLWGAYNWGIKDVWGAIDSLSWQIDKNKNSIEFLTEQYEKWAISQEEYKRRTEELKNEMELLKKQIDDTTEAMAFFDKILDEINKEKIDLKKQFDLGLIGVREYTEWLKELVEKEREYMNMKKKEEQSFVDRERKRSELAKEQQDLLQRAIDLEKKKSEEEQKSAFWGAKNLRIIKNAIVDNNVALEENAKKIKELNKRQMENVSIVDQLTQANQKLVWQQEQVLFFQERLNKEVDSLNTANSQAEFEDLKVKALETVNAYIAVLEAQLAVEKWTAGIAKQLQSLTGWPIDLWLPKLNFVENTKNAEDLTKKIWELKNNLTDLSQKWFKVKVDLEDEEDEERKVKKAWTKKKDTTADDIEKENKRIAKMNEDYYKEQLKMEKKAEDERKKIEKEAEDEKKKKIKEALDFAKTTYEKWTAEFTKEIDKRVKEVEKLADKQKKIEEEITDIQKKASEDRDKINDKASWNLVDRLIQIKEETKKIQEEQKKSYNW